ncbi:MAG: type 1 glutamine amidotransferase family protein [Frisingicoccus sp.]|nr:type 1 glutamine amidotransferase family protein [Frisingicoccus sp.]MDY4833926.1 type 1 glutamine amidotransferase family protein [Frisingicoccus sp.]
MTRVYVYLMHTMADWEIGYCLAELHSKRFFRKDAGEISVKTVSLSKEPVKSMGGLTIIPDMTIEDIQVNKDNVLILPGSDRWSASENFPILEIARRFLEAGGLVAAICGATAALANMGILDDKKHTSNGAGFLNMFCPEYKGTDNYIDKPAVRDGNLITAAGTGALDMTRLILEYLDVFAADTLEHWYAYFSTGNADEFFAMMQSLQK